MLKVAHEEMRRLATFDGTLRSRQELLLRNLSRYFALYTVPSSGQELSRLLGALERVVQRAAVELYGASSQAARSSGAAVIRPTHVDSVLSQVLPQRKTPYQEVVFFPLAPSSQQLIIEEIDLEAFGDTGFPWLILSRLVQDEILPADDALPLEDVAVRRLADGISAYGLLVLRLGGVHARQEFARDLETWHLRQAAKTLAERAQMRDADPAGEGDDDGPTTPFQEVASASGIQFRHVSSDWLSRRRRFGPLAPTFSGGGVSAGDLDGDGWPDLVYCGGQGCAVFRNRHDGSFQEITAETGLGVPGEARMAALADFDNDGRKDVFLTYARDSNRIFRNLGKARFRDVTAGSGLEDEGNISGPAVAVDFDNDGDLDLYVGNFGDYMSDQDPWQTGDAQNALPNRLYRNLGGFEFEDVTEPAGVGNTGWTQALSHLDFDQDGDQDLYVANDFGRNELLLNNGDGTFRSAGAETGSDDPFHGMNAAFADLNRDTHPDIFITNIWTWVPTRKAVVETNSLLLSSSTHQGRVTYEPYRDPAFLRHDTGWSWAALFFDYDNDGDDDLYVVNGFTDYLTFTQYRPSPTDPGQIYPINNGRGPNFFFRNDNGMPLELVQSSGTELPDVNSRSIAYLDYDRDGDLDIAVSTFHSEARLLRNDAAPADNHWLRIELVGDPARGTSRDAIGTQVIARNPDGLYIWRMQAGGEGYLGMSAVPLHLGLGQATSVDLEVIWPGRQRQELKGVHADRLIRITQGSETVETLPWPTRQRRPKSGSDDP